MASVDTLRSYEDQHISSDKGTPSQKKDEKEQILRLPCAEALLFMEVSSDIVVQVVKLFQQQNKPLDIKALMIEAENFQQKQQPQSQRGSNASLHKGYSSEGESEGESLEYVDANSDFVGGASGGGDSKDLETDSEMDCSPVETYTNCASLELEPKPFPEKSRDFMHMEEAPLLRIPDSNTLKAPAKPEMKRPAPYQAVPLLATVAHRRGEGGVAKSSKDKEAQLRKLQLLMMENKRLKKRQQCRQCHNKQVSITFLPCGHYVYCYECGQQFTACPVCKKTILADVRTFLA